MVGLSVGQTIILILVLLLVLPILVLILWGLIKLPFGIISTLRDAPLGGIALSLFMGFILFVCLSSTSLSFLASFLLTLGALGLVLFVYWGRGETYEL